MKVTSYGESDVIATFFTEELGKVSALARAAKKSERRFAAAFEPMHTIRLVLEERVTSDLLTLREAVLERARTHILADLVRIEAAGQALRWARAGSPARTPEPRVFGELTALLDRLDDPTDMLPPETHLAGAGLRLLKHFGYGLELESCARCGKLCEPERSAYVDSTAGGLVCQGCGGGQSPTHQLVDAAIRRRLAAAAGGRDAALTREDTAIARRLVEEALASHAGVVG